jgi:DNA-binding response OmpR family regulator
MKILIIEDEEALLKVLQEKFINADFDVVVAKDGEEGVAVANKEKPDLVLLDLVLPKRDGFEVLEDLKSSDDLKNTPVIVLSNLGEDENLKKALKMGAEDYLVKTQHPINEVIERVKNRLLSKSK